MEERIVALGVKDILTDLHRLSVMQMIKMLETMRSEFKAYLCEIEAGLESDVWEEAAHEQVVFDEHQGKTMEFINHLVDLIAKPQSSDPILHHRRTLV